jgi:hypothetical protein
MQLRLNTVIPNYNFLSERQEDGGGSNIWTMHFEKIA